MQSDKKNLLKSVFNVTNLSGAGAIILSLGMGSLTGTAIFGCAMLVGTFNKYAALQNEDAPQPPQSKFREFLKSPAFTATILMGGAATNCVSEAFNAVANPEKGTLYHSFTSAMWLMGVLGDNALRKLDKTNFSQTATDSLDKKSQLTQTFRAATANPVIFYNGALAFTSLAVLMQTDLSKSDIALNMTVLSMMATATGQSIYKSWNAVQGRIAMDKTNDGISNKLNAVSQILTAIMAAGAGNYHAATAMSIFSIAAIKSIFETNDALEKEGITKKQHNKIDPGPQ